MRSLGLYSLVCDKARVVRVDQVDKEGCTEAGSVVSVTSEVPVIMEHLRSLPLPQKGGDSVLIAQISPREPGK